MEPLLFVLGAVIALGVGWLLGRRPAAERPGIEAEQPRGALALGEVLDELPLGVVIADAQGRHLSRNRSARTMQGTHIGVLLDEAVERHIASAMAGEPSGEVLELYGPPTAVFAVAARPLPSGGSVVLVDDISERHRIDRVRTDFVANISHELKTPIGALSVLAETLEGETDPEIIGRVVGRMFGEVQRATRTIDDLMELSRIELGGERDREAVPITEIVDQALERVDELARQCQIGVTSLGLMAGSDGRAAAQVVDGDRRQLVAAVGNLVENAVKYSEPGGSVQVTTQSADGWVEVIVADRGVGIPQRDLGRIFERFYRVDRARSRQTGGTGLGLSIVRHVASNHGGEVLVTSTEGEGSTFVLRLPVAAVDSSAPSQRDEPVESREEVA